MDLGARPPTAAPAHGDDGHVCNPLCPWYGDDGAGWGLYPLGPDGYRRAQRISGFAYLRALAERVLVYDGATGTLFPSFELTVEDYGGERTDGCPEILLHTRPEVIAEIHRRYLAAGADVIETNSFGALPHVLVEYELQDHAYALAREAARVARSACDAADGERFVAGSLGPGTKLPSLGHIAWEELFASYVIGARGLIDGGADLLLVETCQDILQVRCAVLACREAMRQSAREVPIQAQITMERTGTMLAGTDIGGALNALEGMPIDVIGMNCATGPDLMESHLRHLCAHSSRFISCLPNAGLPRNEGGRAVFDLGPDELARWHASFVRDLGVDAVGGCCGTGPEHIAAVARAVAGQPRAARERRGPTPAASSLYGVADLRQEDGVLFVGERTNATGSKKFRDLLLEDDWDAMVAMAQDQVDEGAHVLDVSVAWTGRDELRDMRAILARLRTAVAIPIMIDSTDPAVIAAALELLPGRAIINSINFEAGSERFDQVCALARQHGAVLVALTIDEDPDQSMAKTVARKVAIAERIHCRARGRHALPGERLLFDLLTFPITQGDEDTRKLAVWTLEAMAILRDRLPGSGFILGLSNVSFGLKPGSRRVLNSVYLDEALAHGLTAAILNAAKIVPVAELSAEERDLTRDLIYDRRTFEADGTCTYDPLFAFIDHFAGRTIGSAAATTDDAAAPIDERIGARLIAGRKQGIEQLIDEALAAGWRPLALINEVLLGAMKVVGERFGAGEMQLPFVLQAAECMKASVRHLEPHLDQQDAGGKGRIVLATVKGDVHDIGKNLVGIILANNGYEVIDLGIKQSVEAIHQAIDAHTPDAVGMSGLLVRSTEAMRDNCAYLAARGVRVPVLCGGAALNRRFVDEDLRGAYGGEAVHYAADAFAGLHLMDAICGHGDDAVLHPAPLPPRRTPARSADPVRVEEPPAVPRPLAWGRQVLADETLDLDRIFALLNRTALFRGRWGFKPGPDSDRLIADEAEPALAALQRRCRDEELLRPAAVVGTWPCAAEGDELVVFAADDGRERCRFALPRMADGAQLCICDFVRPRGAAPLADEEAWFPPAAWAAGARDVLGASCVTMGATASRHAEDLRAADAYRDYLFFHGLAVESAEALAEYVHQTWRARLGIDGDDAADPAGLLRGTYRGCRYSFGYPACPDLAHQRQLQDLLAWGDIGVHLSESDQLVPEQSTSALILHHPQARYFAV